jgi:hypothetical protein
MGGGAVHGPRQQVVERRPTPPRAHFFPGWTLYNSVHNGGINKSWVVSSMDENRVGYFLVDVSQLTKFLEF